MTNGQELLLDLAAAIQDVQLSNGDSDHERRTVRYALLEVYRSREQLWMNGLNKPQKQSYFAEAQTKPAWQTVEALAAVHNSDKHNHALAVRVGFEPLYPDEHVYPSNYLFPGRNLYWRAWEDLPQDVAEAIARTVRGGVAEQTYQHRLGRRLVLETLSDAHTALAGPGPTERQRATR